MTIITDQEAWEYLGFFEQPDEVTLRQIQRATKTAESYLIGAVGHADKDDSRVKELTLMALGFIYDTRTIEGKGSGAVNAMKQSLLAQLRYEREASHEDG